MKPSTAKLLENPQDGSVACQHRNMSCCDACLVKYADTPFKIDGEVWFIRDVYGVAYFVIQNELDKYPVSLQATRFA